MTSKQAAVDDLEIERAFFFFFNFLAHSSGHRWRAAYTAIYVADGVASS